MKKLLCALLAFAMIVSLAACGGEGNGGGNDTPKMIPHTPADGDKFLSLVDSASYAMTLTAHARLKVFFDSKGTVMAVEALNDKGADLFGGSTYAAVSHDWPALVKDILTHMHLQNHLEDASLRLDAAAVDDQDGAEHLLEDAISAASAFFKANGLHVIISTSTTLYPDGILPETISPAVSDNPDVNPSPSPTPAGSNIELGENEVVLEKDKNGNILKTEEKTEEGRIYREYSKKGELTFSRIDRTDGTWEELVYNDGMPVRVTDHEGVITQMSYHTDKSLSIEIIHYPNGDQQETNYDLSGNVTYYLFHRDDGSWEERNYISGGKLSYTVDADDKGNKTTRSYHYNGQISSEVMLGADGYYSETSYNEVGTPVSKSESDADGNRVETSYFANGKRQSRVITYADETVEIWTYAEDGSTGSMTNDSGTYLETYHANDARATLRYTPSEKAEVDFTYEETTYDTEGTLLTRLQVRSDGTKVNYTYHAKDSWTAVFTSPDGSEEYTEYWHKGSQIGGIDADGESYGKTHKEV